MILRSIKLYSIKKRIKKEGETAELLCLLSDYYIQENDFQTALEYVQKALNTDKDYEKSYLMKAVSLYKLGKIKELKDFCIKTEQTAPQYVALFSLAAELFYNDKDYKSAYKYASMGIKAYKSFDELYRIKGFILYKCDKYDKAGKYLLKAEELGCEQDDMFSKLSYIFSLKKDYKTSLKYANKAILLNAKYSYSYYRKGWAHHKMEDYTKAKEAFLKAEQLGYKTNSLYNKLSYIYSLENDYKTSLKYADKAISVNPDDDYSYYRKGWAHCNMEDYTKAKEAFLQAEQLGYKTTSLYNQLSYIYCLEKDYKTSLKYADKAISVNPDDDSYYRKGWAHYELDDYIKAKEAFLKAEELGCNYDDLYYSLSCIYRKDEDYKSSLEYADKAISANPNNGANYLNKATTLFYMENFSEAKDCFFKAEELGIKEEYMFFIIADIFYMESDFEMALHYIDKAIQGNNKYREYYEAKAEILLKLGREEESEKCMQKAAQLDKNK